MLNYKMKEGNIVAHYCLPIEPYKERQQDFPTKYCWVAITKEYNKPNPHDGKKKIDASQLKEYNEMVCNRNKMFKQLDIGYYNCFNKPIEVYNITQEVNCLFNDFSNIFFRIEPISSRTINTNSYYQDKKYNIYEFNVINRCENPTQLIEQLYKDYNLVEFMREVFDRGRYSNDTYKDKCINYFKYCKDNFKDFEINLSDIVFVKYNHYERYNRYKKDEKKAELLAIELIDLNYINLYDSYEYHSSDIFIALINSNWFKLAKRYITKHSDKEIINSIINSTKNDKQFELVKSTLKINNDNEDVKEIIKILNYNEPVLILKAYNNSDWETEIIETKEFNKMDEIRSYLISQYQVPFSKVTGDITDLYHDEKHFVVE